MNRLRWVGSAVMAVALACCGVVRAEGLKDGDRVAICGDSITEQKLYSVYIEDYLLMCKPAVGTRSVQVGWSGETSWGFLARMKQDALVFNPTVATTCYGMNDGGYAALKDEVAARYRQSMTDIVKTFKEGGVRFIVVGSPGCVDTAYFPPGYIGKRFADLPQAEYARVYNEALAKLRDIAREVAKEQGVAYADVYDAMMGAMTKAKAKYGEKYHVAGGDGVHPGPNGHIVMAYAFLKAMGCDGNIGTITVDMGSGKAEASEGHKVVSAEAGKVEIESTRYPFCFFGDPKEPGATSGIIEFVPFNQELNRLTLVVKGAPGRMKVTWGTASKEFSKAQLEGGINLAAEFIENPFCEQFKKVEAAVKEQQMFETPLTKAVFHLKADPNTGHEAGLAALKAGGIRESERLAGAAAAVRPVRHVIKIEAVK